MKQIVCISTACWYPFPTRKQNIMERLDDDCEILYIDPPFTMLAPLKDKSLMGKIFECTKEQPKPKENITVYKPPVIFPFFNKLRSINKINQRILAHFIKSKMKKHGFNNPVIWCYSPASCDIVNLLPHSAVVYDCIDRHSGYGGIMNPQVVDKMEKELCEKSDQIFCTTDGLFDTVSKYNKNTVVIPNGANYELFSKSADKLPAPEAMKEIPHPVFGFVGMLQECIDYKMALAVADENPDGSVVFIGKPLPNVDLSELKKRKNIYLLGLVPQPELPAYISQFDVCLNIFKSGKLSREVSPLKFYEYLATGKPIVSTPEPVQVLKYSSIIEIARSPEEFIEKCHKCAAFSDAEKRSLRMAAGRNSSWDARVDEIKAQLKKDGIF